MYSFGNGSGVGKGTTEPRQYSPWLIEALDGEMIIDVSTGDGHCLALTQSEEGGCVGGESGEQTLNEERGEGEGEGGGGCTIHYTDT